MNYIEWLERNGRKGGLVFLFIGLFLLGACLYDTMMTGSYFVILALVGLALTALGLLAAIFGTGIKNKKNPHAVPVRDLREQIDDLDYPYTLCMRNQRLVPEDYRSRIDPDGKKDPCTTCNADKDHKVITDAKSRDFALTGLEMLED